MTTFLGESLVKEGLDLANKIVPDKNAQLNAVVQSDLAQNDLNVIEAKESCFYACWRPATAWLCVIAFGLHYVIFPLIAYVFCLFGKQISQPQFDMGTLTTLLFYLLGFGTLRSIERVMKK